MGVATMHVSKKLGRQLCFDNGLKIGFAWTHSNGVTSKSGAVLAAYHPLSSVTWLWALYWHRPRTLLCMPRAKVCRTRSGKFIAVDILLPIVGGISFNRQDALRKRARAPQ